MERKVLAICEYCKLNIYEDEKVRKMAGTPLHRKCAKQFVKDTKKEMFG